MQIIEGNCTYVKVFYYQICVCYNTHQKKNSDIFSVYTPGDLLQISLSKGIVFPKQLRQIG